MNFLDRQRRPACFRNKESASKVRRPVQGWTRDPEQAGSRARAKNRLVLSIVEEFALEILQLVLQLID